MKYQIKQLGLGGILDQAFSIVRNHAGLLFGIVALTIVPINIVTGFLQINLQETIAARGDASPILAAIGLFTLFVSLPVSVVVNAAVIYAVAGVYLSQPTKIGDCFRHAFKRLLPLIGTSILMFLAIMGGLILLIIPGIIFAFWFSLAQHVTVLEATSGTAALTRSKALMKGNVGTALALGIVIWIIALGLGIGAGMIPQVHAKIIAVAVAQGITVLLATSAYVVFYFSCRCKVENFDLQVLADAIGDEIADQTVEGVQPAID